MKLIKSAPSKRRSIYTQLLVWIIDYRGLILKLIRPVYSYDNPVDVTLSLLITQILDVDEKNQLIAVECWLTQQWRDVNLQWNPKKYRDVHQVHLPHEWIWKVSNS